MVASLATEIAFCPAGLTRRRGWLFPTILPMLSRSRGYDGNALTLRDHDKLVSPRRPARYAAGIALF